MAVGIVMGEVGFMGNFQTVACELITRAWKYLESGYFGY